MVINTKALFISILKAARADLICDVGSRDGIQALLFHHVLPQATVMAFEANPINFEMMQRNPALTGSRIDMYPFAITSTNGVAKFHITDVNYSNPDENRGTSSLLICDGLKVLKSVEVETRRLDDFILNRFPNAGRIGIWIDVEGVECAVLEGLTGIAERVVAVHVETARQPLRQSHRTFDELLPLMNSQGFVMCGSNMNRDSVWGDVVFVRQEMANELGARLSKAKTRAWLSYVFKADQIAFFTKARWPFLYRVLRRAYIRLWA